MLIREETVSDIGTIDRLTTDAFAPMPFSDGTEAPILRRLRDSGDLTLSLVAVDRDALIGHIAFSPVSIDDIRDQWFGLGPISVRADHQRRGVGTALVAEGLSRLSSRGARGVALIGDPKIYRSMGFTSNGRLRYPGVDPSLVQYIVIDGREPAGELRVAPAFDA